MKSTNKDMADSMFFWGVAKTYKIGMAVYETSFDRVSNKVKIKIDSKTTAIADKIKKNLGKAKPNIKTKAFFNIMRMMQKNGWCEVDKSYWSQKGWDKKDRPWK